MRPTKALLLLVLEKSIPSAPPGVVQKFVVPKNGWNHVASPSWAGFPKPGDSSPDPFDPSPQSRNIRRNVKVESGGCSPKGGLRVQEILMLANVIREPRGMALVMSKRMSARLRVRSEERRVGKECR